VAKKKRQRKNIGNDSGIGRRVNQLAAEDMAAVVPAGTEYREVIDRSRLHPSLRHLADDDEISIIITTGSSTEPPEGAGHLLGELSQGMFTEDGTPLPAGSRVWADLREGTLEERARSRMQPGAPLAKADAIVVPSAPGKTGTVTRLPRDHPLAQESAARGDLLAGKRGMQAEVPAAFLRPGTAGRLIGDPDRFASALEDQQPGLTEKLGRGLSPEELADPANLQAIARAASAGGEGRYSVVQGAARGAMPAKVITGGTRTDGGEGLPGGLRPGDIIAAERPAGYRPAGIPLPEGYAGDPGDQVWRPLAESPPGGPELIVTDSLDALDATDADLVIEDLDSGDPDDSGRVLVGSAATVRGWHDRMDAADRRGAKLIPGTADTSALARSLEAAEAIGLRENWTADQVLAAHEWLAKHYLNPGDDLADYLAFHIRNSLEQDHKTASMFWPVDLTKGADFPEGAKMARLIGRGLESADTIQVTTAMCRKMHHDRGSLNGLVTLDEGLLPEPAGLAWLDAPWLTETAAGYWLPVRAVSWERITVLANTEQSVFGIPAGSRGTPVDAVRIVLWLRIPDDVAFGRWKNQEKRAVKVANQVGNLVPQQIVILPFGARVNLGTRFRTNGRELMSLLHILWKTLGETLPRSRPVRVALPGGPRRAARRTLRHSDVRIVTLREYAYDSDPVQHHPQPVDWSCRWWTEKFYRHIDYYEDGTDEKGRNRRHKPVPASQPGLLPDDDHDVCAVCLANGQTVRISYVAGFWKGPPGKPIRVPAAKRTVYRLAR
jgi:hypothetical protein